MGKGAAFLLLALLAPAGFGQGLHTTHGRQDRYHVTEGWIDARGWAQRAEVALGDFPGYRRWGLRGLDGQDPESAGFWVQLRDYRQPQPSVLEVEYDVHIGWFLNVSGNHARFRIVRSGEGRVELVMDQPPLGLEDARVTLEVVESRVVFRAALRFWGVIDSLLDEDRYRQTMEWRLARLAENLRDLLGVTP